MMGLQGWQATDRLTAQDPPWLPVVEGRFRLGVTGGRYFNDRDTVQRVFMTLNLGGRVTVVHGNAPGADTLAASVAREIMAWEREAHVADWHRLGKAAGPARNQEMIDSRLDLVVAFAGGAGTADMVRRAREAGILVLRVEL